MSALFWEERNSWYADVWDIRGVRQLLENTAARKRSAAFPFEIAYRLISMYSVKGDQVLDPFLGTGTTVIAAVASCRDSSGVEVNRSLEAEIRSSIALSTGSVNRHIAGRLINHLRFVDECAERGKRLKYRNRHYDFPVMTAQEQELMLNFVKQVDVPSGNLGTVQANYYSEPSLMPPGVALEQSLFPDRLQAMYGHVAHSHAFR